MCRFCLNHPPPHNFQLHDAGDPGVALFKNVTRGLVGSIGVLICCIAELSNAYFVPCNRNYYGSSH